MLQVSEYFVDPFKLFCFGQWDHNDSYISNVLNLNYFHSLRRGTLAQMGGQNLRGSCDMLSYMIVFNVFKA